MSLPGDYDSKISSAAAQIHAAGGDEALTVALDLLAGIAQSLNSAKQGQAAMDDISTSIENAEARLHEIVAELINS